MNIRFYLKRPKSESATVICAQLNYNMTSFRYYLPIKIQPNEWNFKLQRMEKNNNYVDFNNRLEWIASKITDVFYNYINNNDGRMPTKEVFRNLLETVFEKRKASKLPPKREVSDVNFGILKL